MRSVKFGIILFLAYSIAFAGNLEKTINAPLVTESKPSDQNGRAQDLITKIYSQFFPLDLSPSRKVAHLYPGELYDVGGYRLHMFCTGPSKQGVPTIILESGAGSYSTAWVHIQRELSKRTRVCAYDRAGYGWSDEWPAQKDAKSVLDVIPRTIDHNVEALDRLLNRAGVSNSIILVGSSYGGPLSLAFEAKYPTRVSGLVLVDPHDDGVSLEDSPYNEAVSESLRELEKEKSPEGQAEWEKKFSNIAQHLSSHQNGQVQAPVLLDDLSSLVNFLNPINWLRSMFSEWRALHSGCAKMKAHPSKTLNQKSLIVISSDPANKGSEGRIYLHMKLCKQSSKGKLLIAKGAGHDIARDRPDLIIKAVDQLLEGKLATRLEEESLPQMHQPTKVFVDDDLANLIRLHRAAKEGDERLNRFCQQLGLAFRGSKDFGYVDHRKTGAGGYFVVCE